RPGREDSPHRDLQDPPAPDPQEGHRQNDCRQVEERRRHDHPRMERGRDVHRVEFLRPRPGAREAGEGPGTRLPEVAVAKRPLDPHALGNRMSSRRRCHRATPFTVVWTLPLLRTATLELLLISMAMLMMSKS